MLPFCPPPNPSKSYLGGVFGVILAVLAALEDPWSVLGSSWAILKASWTVLGGSWGVLEASWSPPGNLYVCTRVHSCALVCPVAGTQGAPIRILYDFPDLVRNIIRNIRKDMRNEIRI